MLVGDESPIAGLLREANPNVSMASWALRFAASLEGVYVTLSGMSSYDQLADNVKTFADFKPLTQAEQAVLEEAVRIFNAVPRIPCTECNYCVGECPAKIQIPAFIDLYNEYNVHRAKASLAGRYGMMTREGGKASECVACRKCEGACPQSIGISDIIAQVSEVFD